MNNAVTRCLGTAFVVALCVATAIPATAQIPASIGVDVTSKYVYRGFAMVDEITVQPNAQIDLGATGLSLELWGSFASTERTAFEQNDEFDATVRFDKSLGQIWEPLKFAAGFTAHTFPSRDQVATHTEEFFLGASASLPLIDGGLTVYHDVNVIKGTYVQAYISPPAALLQGLAVPGLDVKFSAAMSDYVDSFGFHDFRAELAYGIPLLGILEAGPMAGFSYAADAIDPDNTNFWGGIHLKLKR